MESGLHLWWGAVPRWAEMMEFLAHGRTHHPCCSPILSREFQKSASLFAEKILHYMKNGLERHLSLKCICPLDMRDMGD